MIVINNNFKEEVLDYKGTVLVDFYADWCGPCKMLSPVLEEISNETDIKICKVNVDENQALAIEYKVMSIPTLIVFKEGKKELVSVGLKSKEEILEMIK
ncbi:MAG: thioredoxin [Bacilli bacterium]|jgi:thioredoxin 1|nr:thioredoxin [Bacilli bacterium]